MENRISIDLSDETLTELDTLLTAIEDLLKDKLVSLTALQNRRYGKLGFETENFAHMIHSDTSIAAEMIPHFVNRIEWNKDMAARKALSPRLARITAITERIEATHRLVGYDIYKTSLAVYNNAKMLATQNVDSAGTYYHRWRVQFPFRRKKEKEAPAK